MQVESRLPSGLYHAHAQSQKARVNGVHSDSNPNYPASTNGHSRGNEMHPYQQQHYAAGPPVPQQRQYHATQLPPMYPGMNISPMPGQPGPSVAGPSNVSTSVMYNPTGQLPPPSQSLPPQHQDQHGNQRLSVTGTNSKYQFELRVEQEPQRARMCGFGDKDRRPITPPPCIKLVITDLTGNPIPTSQIDGSFFVLQVDLWDEQATREVNIVRSSSTSPAVSISTATTTSYPPLPDRPPMPDYQPTLVYTADGQAVFRGPQGYAAPSTMHPYSNMGYAPSPYPGPAGSAQYAPLSAGGHQPSTSMYTRNLIGSLTVNASLLKDNDGEEAFWFVLQDLSVRTEGFFRLKMNFIDVGALEGEGLNKGRAPVLAYAFSHTFQVYSAKKFPGVIESTPLSKCFAQQGIKIPIRKDMKMEEVDPDEA